jgi:hypothetical protein
VSHENVEIVRSIYTSLNDGTGVPPSASPTATSKSPFNEGRTLEPIEDERVVESGDQVVAVINSHLRPRGTEAEFEMRNGHIWTIRDGVALSLRGFPNPEEALEAAGLRQ